MPCLLPSTRLAALRHRDYRLLWSGLVVSLIGSQMQGVAVNWHVYQLLRGTSYTLTLLGWRVPVSAGALGLGTLGLVRVLPIIAFALLGGMIADALDRRRVILWAQVAAAVNAAVLAAVTLSGHVDIA